MSHPLIHKLTAAVTDNPVVLTYGAVPVTITFWGLRISDWAVLISAFAAVLGVVLQFYVSMRRLHMLEHEAAASKKVVAAVSEAQRVVAGKVDAIELKQGP